MKLPKNLKNQIDEKASQAYFGPWPLAEAVEHGFKECFYECASLTLSVIEDLMDVLKYYANHESWDFNIFVADKFDHDNDDAGNKAREAIKKASAVLGEE